MKMKMNIKRIIFGIAYAVSVSNSCASQAPEANWNEVSDGPALIEVVTYSNLKVVVSLLAKKGANVNYQNGRLQTSLHLAAMQGHLEVAKKLIDAKANVNFQDNYGQTPLHFTPFIGHSDLVKTLIDSKANFDFQNNKGETVLSYAYKNNKPNIVKILQEAKEKEHIARSLFLENVFEEIKGAVQMPQALDLFIKKYS